jgi:hypothetical protein
MDRAAMLISAVVALTAPSDAASAIIRNIAPFIKLVTISSKCKKILSKVYIVLYLFEFVDAPKAKHETLHINKFFLQSVHTINGLLDKQKNGVHCESDKFTVFPVIYEKT